jgi:UDP-N-acetylmuramyl tripeptide synthase
LAEGKFVVTRVAKLAVINADDEVVAARGDALQQPVVWFSLDAQNPRVTSSLEKGGAACYFDGDSVYWQQGTDKQSILPVNEIPVTMQGAARYNIANVLAAVAIAQELGLELAHIQAGLRSFQNSVADNPGRLNHFEIGGVQAIVDYAHNPHGFDAVFEMMNQIPAQRRLVLLGQAGDREETSIRELARQTCAAQPDLIVIKEMQAHLRGRELGEVPAIIEEELRLAGAREDQFTHAPSEPEAVRTAFAWAQPGDLLMLLCHDQRDAVLTWLTELQASDWEPGQAPPAI